MRMKMIFSYRLPQLFDLILYMNIEILLRVKIDEKIRRIKNKINIATINEIMKIFLISIFFIKMKKIDNAFSLFFVSNENVNNSQN